MKLITIPVTPQFVAVNVDPIPDRPGYVSCQIIDRDHRDTPGHPCVDILAISQETLELWDRIQHEASLYRSLIHQMQEDILESLRAKYKPLLG